MAKADTDQFGATEKSLEALAAYCPTDMVVWSIDGDDLTLRGGLDSSGWSVIEIVVRGVTYMALPMDMKSVTLRTGSEESRQRVKKACNGFDESHTVFELVEDEDWREGRKVHLVAAEAVGFTAPPQ